MIAVFAVWGSGPAAARTTATTGQQAVGEGCSGKMSGADFDTIFQCNNEAGGTKQTAPLVVGTVTAPPYAATTCDASKAGMIQWTGSAFQGCDGTSWGEFSFGSGSSSTCTPDAFSFTDQTEVSLGSTITSNAVTLSGSNFAGCIAPALCTGCSAILRNGIAEGTSALFRTGDTIALQLTSSSASEASVTASVTVGVTTSSIWSVTTSPDPCAGASPTLGAVCADGSVYAGLSPDGNEKMYTTLCDYGQTWSGSACTGTRGSLQWGTYAVTTGYTSTTDGDGNTAGLVANYGSYTDSQSVYGVPAAQACADLTSHGYSDWYLPAKDELNVLYDNHSAIGGFNTSGTYYWSSSESSHTSAWIQRFSDGNQANNAKDDLNLVRCVRR